MPQSARLSAGGGGQSPFGQCPNRSLAISDGASLIDHCQTFLLSTISSLEKFEKSKLNFICKTNSEGGATHVDRKGRDLTRVGSQLLQGVVDNNFFF